MILNCFLLIISIIILVGCHKKDTFENDSLLGKWTSNDASYLLEFTTESDFLKNGDHYNYWLKHDSITIQYNGILYIYVKPTTHFYTMSANALTIDFSSGCYGFTPQIIHFTRHK
jgi:hypothetical protein